MREAKPVFEARKPIFIDKPLAGSLADAVQIYDLGRKHNVPWFSSSSVRYYPGFQNTAKAEPIVGAQTWGPCTYLEGTPDMFNYGIHGIEALYTLMGAGCESVVRTQTPDTDVVSGVWNGGRVGTYRGIRNAKADFGGVAFTAKSISVVEKSDGYQHLCKEIGRFFKSGKSPVSPEETLEIMSFMEAADESKRQGGAPVKISEVISKARATARPL